MTKNVLELLHVAPAAGSRRQMQVTVKYCMALALMALLVATAVGCKAISASAASDCHSHSLQLMLPHAANHLPFAGLI